METYVILRRHGWKSPAQLEEAAARSRAEADRRPDDMRWIRSYVMAEDDGTVGTVCIYQASSEEALRKHAEAADLQFDEAAKMADTVIVREDAAPAAA